MGLLNCLGSLFDTTSQEDQEKQIEEIRKQSQQYQKDWDNPTKVPYVYSYEARAEIEDLFHYKSSTHHPWCEYKGKGLIFGENCDDCKKLKSIIKCPNSDLLKFT